MVKFESLQDIIAHMQDLHRAKMMFLSKFLQRHIV